MINLFPSHQLTLDSQEQPDFKLHPLYPLGKSIFIPYDDDIKSLIVAGKEVTRIENYFFAASPFTKRRHFEIYGEFNNGPIVGFNNFFKHPVNSFFKIRVPLDQPIKKSPQLRLPAAVWKKVNDQHKSQKQKERKLIAQLYKSETPLKNHSCWIQPLYSKVVSQYSAPRTLPNNRSYLHSGLDLRARSPKPILAVAEGEILYAGHMIVPGGNVLIDHGAGLFSRYMHMSEFEVQAGDSVQKGQVVGLTGGSGRVEAPHLHWEVLWKGRPLNPQLFIKDWGRICAPKFAH